jgi:hypothetical protein
LKLLPPLAVVIDFAVEGERKAAIFREHRLVSGGARINDRQPPVAQASAPPLIVYRLRCPDTFVVAPAMLYRRKHRADAPLWIQANKPGNAAHIKAVTSDK